jgi:hypothetical protein
MNVLLARLSILSVYVFAIAATLAHAQSPTVTSVPRIVRVTSTFHPADGKQPAAVETMTLSIYAEETGGVPLWQETQTVSVNPDGRFTLLLGSTRPEGLPLDLFAAGEPRWLAIHIARPGEGEPAYASDLERRQLRQPRQTPPMMLGRSELKGQGDFKFKCSGQSDWTPCTTPRVSRVQVVRLFCFRSLSTDLRSPPSL